MAIIIGVGRWNLELCILFRIIITENQLISLTDKKFGYAEEK